MYRRFVLAAAIAAIWSAPSFAQDTLSGIAAFRAPLSPSSENPPITDKRASGEALILIHMQRDSTGVLTRAVVDFHIDYFFEAPERITAMHIHRAPRGTNGPVVIDSVLGEAFDVAPGEGKMFRQNDVTSTAVLEIVQALLDNPAGYYVNVHTMSKPPGIIRGQLEPVDRTEILMTQKRVLDRLAALETALADKIGGIDADNAALAGELAAVRTTMARVARRLGVVPVE